MLIAAMSKNLPNFCSDGYFEFLVKIFQKSVKIYNSDAFFFV